MSRLICIGASTGGTGAIEQILTSLPQNMPPILIALHMPPMYTRLFAKKLNGLCAMPVVEGCDGMAVEPGKAIVAPGKFNMSVEGNVVRCVSMDCPHLAIPSVDALFFSAAALKDQAIGVILTGMGSDGTEGLLAMSRAGAVTLGQDEESCVVYGMPKSAYLAGAVSRQVSLDGMAEAILESI